MGYVPDWNRQHMGKTVQKFADGGEADGLIEDVSTSPVAVQGGASSFKVGSASGVGGGGRVSMKTHLDDDRHVELGASGSISKVKVDAGENSFKKTQAKLTGVDATYVDEKKNFDVGASYEKRMGPDGKSNNTVMVRFNKRF